MKKITLISAIGAFSAVLAANFAFAQSVSGPTLSASDLISAINALEAVDAARQSVLDQMNRQFAQISDETANLAALPAGTQKENEANAAELNAIAAKLNELAAAAATLNQIAATESSLRDAIQAEMQGLGIQ